MSQAIITDESAREHRWLADSLVPSPPVELAIVRGPCPLERLPAVRADPDAEIACTFPGGALYLPVWVENRGDFFHELGHQFDYHMSDQARTEFLLLTRDVRPWRFDGPNSPHERFAEAYSFCARYTAVRPRMPGDFAYGWMPHPRRHKLACRLIRREAFRQGWFLTAPAQR